MERTWIRPKVYLISREMGDVQVANWRKSTTDTTAACPKLKSLIRHLHIYNAPCLPPNFCISNLSNLYWNDYNTREKWKTKVMQNFGGQTRFIMGDVEMATSSHKHCLNDDRTTAPNWNSFFFPFFLYGYFFNLYFLSLTLENHIEIQKNQVPYVERQLVCPILCSRELLPVSNQSSFIGDIQWSKILWACPWALFLPTADMSH